MRVEEWCVRRKDGKREVGRARGSGDVYFFFNKKSVYEISNYLVGSKMYFRDRYESDAAECAQQPEAGADLCDCHPRRVCI